ncbi:MAG TPA: NAD(P)-dependent oxidoreductase [Candidatus Dormibacteraeota bacterium]|jgi:3-hydroxyisobutyrate dehydrogenase-like beta-hydroxyacid dehydrogenase|nr:NAD(P)-dependent oxidoreductase [Candidatus Dormibacteraeota bacterium]
MRPVLGFVGLGNMGQPMAANLLKAGYAVRVWDRTPARAAALAAEGATSVPRPEEVAEAGALVISSLANDRVLEEVVGASHELLRRLGPGGIHVSASTVAPATSRRLAEGHKHYGVTYLAAPVLGRPDAAAAAKLWIFVSGPAEAKERAWPALRALGQGVFDLGEDPGAANVVKLACNFLLAAAIEAMAEAFTLAEKNGIERRHLADLLVQTLFDCPAYRNYAGLIAEQRYQPALFKLSLGLKDVSLVRQTAASSLVPMPLAGLLHDHFLAAAAKGRGDLDWTGLAGEVSEAAGLRPPPSAESNPRTDGGA